MGKHGQCIDLRDGITLVPLQRTQFHWATHIPQRVMVELTPSYLGSWDYDTYILLFTGHFRSHDLSEPAPSPIFIPVPTSHDRVIQEWCQMTIFSTGGMLRIAGLTPYFMMESYHYPCKNPFCYAIPIFYDGTMSSSLWKIHFCGDQRATWRIVANQSTTGTSWWMPTVTKRPEVTRSTTGTLLGYLIFHGCANGDHIFHDGVMLDPWVTPGMHDIFPVEK